MEIMNNMRARHLPVEKNGRLVGIVSIGDAVRHHIRAIEHEAEHIKAYIAGQDGRRLTCRRGNSANGAAKCQA